MEPQNTPGTESTSGPPATTDEPATGGLSSPLAQAALADSPPAVDSTPGVVVTDSKPAVFQPPTADSQPAAPPPNPSVVSGTVDSPPKKSLLPVDLSSFSPRVLMLAGGVFFLLMVIAGVMAYFGLG